jgi:hypothetical protein
LLLQTNILPGDLFPGIGSVLVRINLLDVISIITLSKATYRKMVQNLECVSGIQFDRYPPDGLRLQCTYCNITVGWGIFNGNERDNSGYQCQVPESKNTGIKRAK